MGDFPGIDPVLSFLGPLHRLFLPLGMSFQALSVWDAVAALEPGAIRSCHGRWLLRDEAALASLYSHFSQTYLLPQPGHELLEGGDLVLLNPDVWAQGQGAGAE